LGFVHERERLSLLAKGSGLIASAVVVFRETLEAALIVAIVMGASREVSPKPQLKEEACR
jgi:high-affinity Fe2+/Pb2+ permease